ncbi:Substrate binding domain of ABC-type glycine betaine transport system [Micrococcus luteus]|uniref:glycine betaine ABC transporter substrate-binding protein n=1 Tax=Micrococcus luteus TaxID=1270 RepID=UPI000E037674|nr:glycine betaine ABC transporter substrate-binding protein [Micrococcus luteus]STY74191.1 Substrate binding domain of ABC-type glycine betaine transport system [Micrococcus luteus]
MSRPAHRRPAALAASALVLSLALGACARQADAPPTPSASGAPMTVVHGGEGLEAAVAAVLARHLRLHGHAVADEDGVAVEQPAWSAAGGDTVAVVDTLALAAAADPAAALPSPPSTPTSTPSSTPTGTEAGTSADAVPTPSATPSATASTAAPSPTALPVGDPAADAPAAGRVLETLLSEETAAAGTPQAEAPAALSSSAGVLRLTAVVTQTTAARLELESITDLNGRCESLTAVAPPALTAAADADAALRTRLDRLAGCRPETWLADTEDPTAAVVADEAQVALLTGTDPEIDANTLVLLEDDGRVLPEGRLTAVGSAATLDDDAERRIAEVMSALDGDGLRELERLTTGADPLPVAEAAQYWLVDHGLEDAPEDWFVPRGSWF